MFLDGCVFFMYLGMLQFCFYLLYMTGIGFMGVLNARVFLKYGWVEYILSCASSFLFLFTALSTFLNKITRWGAFRQLMNKERESEVRAGLILVESEHD